MARSYGSIGFKEHFVERCNDCGKIIRQDARSRLLLDLNAAYEDNDECDCAEDDEDTDQERPEAIQKTEKDIARLNEIARLAEAEMQLAMEAKTRSLLSVQGVVDKLTDEELRPCCQKLSETNKNLETIIDEKLRMEERHRQSQQAHQKKITFLDAEVKRLSEVNSKLALEKYSKLQMIQKLQFDISKANEEMGKRVAESYEQFFGFLDFVSVTLKSPITTESWQQLLQRMSEEKEALEAQKLKLQQQQQSAEARAAAQKEAKNAKRKFPKPRASKSKQGQESTSSKPAVNKKAVPFDADNGPTAEMGPKQGTIFEMEPSSIVGSMTQQRVHVTPARAPSSVEVAENLRGKRKCIGCKGIIASASADCCYCGFIFRPSRWNQQQANLTLGSSENILGLPSRDRKIFGNLTTGSSSFVPFLGGRRNYSALLAASSSEPFIHTQNELLVPPPDSRFPTLAVPIPSSHTLPPVPIPSLLTELPELQYYELHSGPRTSDEANGHRLH